MTRGLRSTALGLGYYMLTSLAPEYRSLADLAATGSDDAQMMALMFERMKDGDIEVLFQNCCRILDMLDVAVVWCRGEKKRLDGVIGGYLQAKDRVRKGMTAVLIARNLQSVDTEAGYAISLTKATAKLDVRQPELLPDAFYRVKREVDKESIRAALDAGKEVPGAFLIEGEQNITVRGSKMGMKEESDVSES